MHDAAGWTLTRRALLAVMPGALLGATAPVEQPVTAARVGLLLQQRTQELLDAIVPGDREPWRRYVHANAIYGSEDGVVKTKTDLLHELVPMPAEIQGRLRLTAYRAVVHDRAVVANYIVEESQVYYGQAVSSRYMATDTWVSVGDDWQLAASQVLALSENPPALVVAEHLLDAYSGTYELAAGMAYVIERAGRDLIGRQTGRDPEALRVEVVDCLFVPGQPRLRKVFERDADGRVTGFVDRLESGDVRWRRVR